MKKAAPPPVAYALEDDVEMAAVLATCSEPRFFQAVGRALDPERMRDARARVLVAGAIAVATKAGYPPTWPSLVTQHLATLMNAGKITLDQVLGAKDYLIEAMHLPTVSVDDLVAVVAPVIQRVQHKEAIVDALDGYKNNASPAEAAARLEAVAKVGKFAGTTTATLSTIVGAPDFFTADLGETQRFGVPELDEPLGGGLERSAMGLIVGGTGSGKSMALVHLAVEAVLAGRHVLYVTLELSPRRVAQRIMRNLVNMTRREVRFDPAEASRRFAMIMAITRGQFVIVDAPPLVTSPRDIRALADQAMREHRGFDPDTFVVDFMDKLRVNQKASLYEDMLAVADGIRQLATDTDGWAWTAAQSDRKSTNRPWLDLDATADSMNKVRSADLMIAIGRTEEDKQADLIRFSVPKRREGEGAYTRVGPIPWDPERGRISVVSDRMYPW